MNRLVTDLLQLSKMDFQEKQWIKEIIELPQIVEDVVMKLDVTVKQKDMEIDFDFPDKPLTILGDRDSIEQVILNILGNAIKYTPEGGNIKIRGT